MRDDDDVLRFALDLEVRTTEEDLEEASKKEKTEKIGLKKGGCPESSKRSASNCRRNGVNSAISAYGTTPDKN